MTTKKTMDEVALQALQSIADGTPVEVAPYVMELMAASHRDYQATIENHIAYLEGVIADRNAELGAIRRRINELFSGPYMPREEAILMAVFHPSRELIEKVRTNNLEGES